MRAKLGVKITPSLVVATLALMVALGGTTYAALRLPAGSVGSKQIQNGAVTSSKLSRSVSRSIVANARTDIGVVLGPKVAQCSGGGACQVQDSIATCPRGWLVVGGGYRTTAIDTYVYTAAENTQNGFAVLADDNGPLTGSVQAQAICITGANVYSAARDIARSKDTGSGASVTQMVARYRDEILSRHR